MKAGVKRNVCIAAKYESITKKHRSISMKRDPTFSNADAVSCHKGKYNNGPTMSPDVIQPFCPAPNLPAPPSDLQPLWLTSLQAGEGQSVLAHKVAGEEPRLLADTEADEAKLRHADVEVHVRSPVRTQSCNGNQNDPVH